MSRLAELINTVILKEGSAGKARLALVAEREQRMVERYKKGQSIPQPDKAYKLALACGSTEEVALEIAKECASGG